MAESVFENNCLDPFLIIGMFHVEHSDDKGNLKRKRFLVGNIVFNELD